MRRSPLTHVLIAAARLAAVLAILAVHLTASGGGDAVAAPYTPHPDFVSVNGFKRDCTRSGGSIETTEGSIACFHENGSVIVCDENARNCSYFPPSSREQTTPGPFAGPLDVADITDAQLEEQTPASAIDPATGEGITSLPAGTNANAVRVWTFVCPAGTDPNGEMTWGQMYQTCNGQKAVPPFPISVSVDGIPYGIVEPDYTGIPTLSGLPPGTITLHVEAHYPYKKAAAFCYAHLNNQTDRPINRYQVTGTWSTSIHDLLPNQFVGCSWFFINPSPGYVYVKKYECPAGINITNVSASQLKQACPVSRTPVEFILTSSSGVSHEYTSAYSEVAFKYLDAGPLTIREGVPAGFGVPIVYCDTTRATAGGLVTVRQYQRQIMASPDSIQSTIETVGDAISCDWFNVPGTLPAGSGQEPPRDLPAEAATPPDAMPTETPTETPPPTATAAVTPTDEPVIEPTFEPTDAGPWTVPEGTIPVFEPVEPTPTPVILT
jgi:hypothetical protein